MACQLRRRRMPALLEHTLRQGMQPVSLIISRVNLRMLTSTHQGCAATGSRMHVRRPCFPRIVPPLTSRLHLQRAEARLENIQSGDDWQAMCNTTPNIVHGFEFDHPTSCENRVSSPAISIVRCDTVYSYSLSTAGHVVRHGRDLGVS